MLVICDYCNLLVQEVIILVLQSFDVHDDMLAMEARVVVGKHKVLVWGRAQEQARIKEDLHVLVLLEFVTTQF